MLIRDSIFHPHSPINNRMLRKPRTYLFIVLSLALAGCSNAIPKFKVEGGGNGVVIQRPGARHDLMTANYKLKGSFHYATQNASTTNYKLSGAIKRSGEN